MQLRKGGGEMFRGGCDVEQEMRSENPALAESTDKLLVAFFDLSVVCSLARLWTSSTTLHRYFFRIRSMLGLCAIQVLTTGNADHASISALCGQTSHYLEIAFRCRVRLPAASI
eukprot:2618313-Amphidinium_carterae.1